MLQSAVEYTSIDTGGKVIHDKHCLQAALLELHRDEADVELLKMQQGLSATLKVDTLPDKNHPHLANRPPARPCQSSSR